jgi:type IX secretion system PorP/SprF family membrane protein
MLSCIKHILITLKASRKLLLRSVFIGGLCAVVSSLVAQDVHFTQFFSNPLILNPSQTGNYEGNYRVGFNFKAQWPFAISGKVYNYHTEAPYVDFSFGERKLKSAWFGLGLNFLNDEAGDGRLTYRRMSLSAAYHQAFDKDHRYILSTGFGLSYIIRSVDFSKFYFNNQWVDDFGFNITLPNNEPLQRESFQMVDLNAGINLGAQIHNQVKLDFGFAMMHLNRPKHSFLGTTERLGLRYQANFGITYTVNERIAITANAYYGNEKKAQEITAGAMLEYGFINNRHSVPSNTVYLGLYYRGKDALAPVIGYQYKNTRLLFNYDVTLSGLSKPGKANGGPEISIVHKGSFYKHFGSKKVYCPEF